MPTVAEKINEIRADLSEDQAELESDLQEIENIVANMEDSERVTELENALSEISGLVADSIESLQSAMTDVSWAIQALVTIDEEVEDLLGSTPPDEEEPPTGEELPGIPGNPVMVIEDAMDFNNGPLNGAFPNSPSGDVSWAMVENPDKIRLPDVDQALRYTVESNLDSPQSDHISLDGYIWPETNWRLGEMVITGAYWYVPAGTQPIPEPGQDWSMLLFHEQMNASDGHYPIWAAYFNYVDDDHMSLSFGQRPDAGGNWYNPVGNNVIETDQWHLIVFEAEQNPTGEVRVIVDGELVFVAGDFPIRETDDQVYWTWPLYTTGLANPPRSLYLARPFVSI